ncbi:MAG: hypothetical protein IJ390_01390 [Lachnospiraceae bacterium]|nr:hypothetical protein [Lachnospiraceae bacterium]
MELEKIFSLYDRMPPVKYEIKDTSRGEADFRQAVIAEWEDKKLVIKITCNAFTTTARVKCWHDTIEAYNAAGYYCPEIVQNCDNQYAELWSRFIQSFRNLCFRRT